MIFGVATDILDTDRYFKIVARGPDLLRRMTRDGKGVRHRQEVMRITPIDAAPAEMVGKPGSICVLNESFEAPEVFPIEFVGRSEIDRDTMLNYPVLFQNRVQHLQGPASVHHEIFRDDFKP